MRWRWLRRLALALCLLIGAALSLHTAYLLVGAVHDGAVWADRGARWLQAQWLTARAEPDRPVRVASSFPSFPSINDLRYEGAGPTRCTPDRDGLSCDYPSGVSVWISYGVVSHASSGFAAETLLDDAGDETTERYL